MIDVATLTPTDIFRLIAKEKPGFTPRKGQVELSDLVTEISQTPGQHLLAEAPTGFGKSFSALIPAIIRAVQDKKRTIISTETLNLQAQYITKDLPLLQKVCAAAGLHFTFAVAKGRSNFICRLKLDEDLGQDQTRMVSGVQRWAMLQQVGQHAGDRADIPFETREKEWQAIGADEDCERKGCPFYGEGRRGFSDCFVYTAQRQFSEADIVVTNHKLFLLDTLYEAGSLLGHYALAIIDEGHTIPEQAQNTWGMEIKPHTVTNTLRLLNRILRRSGLNYFEAGFIEQYEQLQAQMFSPFTPILKNSMFMCDISSIVVQDSKDAAKVLIEHLVVENKLLKDFMDANPHAEETIKAARDRLAKLISSLRAIYGEGVEDEYKDNWVVYVECAYSSKREKYPILHLKPIDVAPLVRANILDAIPNVVFMSATLRIGESFGFMRRELGMAAETTTEFVGETPFNFYEQVEGYFPDDLPDPDQEGYFERVCKRLRTIIKRRKGRCLVLFTSNDLMRRVWEDLHERVPYRCYLQGEASKNVLTARFKAEVDACLFGTRSFFQGVDFPGETLSTVVLVKAPFRVPSDPLFKAKCQRMEEKGTNSFSSYALPLMITDVRQCFGRLIRDVRDVGMFALLDSRAARKPYGRQIKKALPRIRWVEQIDRVD